MKPRRRRPRDPRRIGIPPAATRGRAERHGVSLLHARRAFERDIAHMGPGALRRAEDGWSYARREVQLAWNWLVEGVLLEAGRHPRAEE